MAGFRGVDAFKAMYERLEIFGKEVLFTYNRVYRESVPMNMYAYDIRHDDDCQGIMCEIAPHILVNHWGTIICREPIEMTDDGRRFIDDEKDTNYLGTYTTLEDWIEEG